MEDRSPSIASCTYISGCLVSILVRIIVQFQTKEDLATFAGKHPAPDENVIPEKGFEIRITRQLALAPIAIVDMIADDLPREMLDNEFPDGVGIMFKEPDVDFFLSATSANNVLGMDSINASIYGPFQGDGIAVAVVDGGIDATHPDLHRTTITRTTFIHDGSKIDAGHGTAMAGIICGSGAMSKGHFKGITRNVTLLDCVAFDASGHGMLADVLAAIDGAVLQGVKIFCLPFNSRPGREPSPIFEYYLDTLVKDHDIIFCCGSGNLGPIQGTIGMPGCYPCVITTGSTSLSFIVSRFSGRGMLGGKESKPDFCLPGEQAVSLNHENSRFKDAVLDANEYYAMFSGNSVSVAILTSLVVAIRSARPDATPAAIKQLLKASCVKIRKSAPISSGMGLVSPALVFTNMNKLYARSKGFTAIVRDAVSTTVVLFFFAIAMGLMIASFL
ncbi:MAG: S8 family serine peptidase [Candidatus Lokiarchaeota archaeon]|nr:S8 family serine peptidase [Candidatus Lokiarchaeota archaeon]